MHFKYLNKKEALIDQKKNGQQITKDQKNLDIEFTMRMNLHINGIGKRQLLYLLIRLDISLQQIEMLKDLLKKHYQQQKLIISNKLK